MFSRKLCLMISTVGIFCLLCTVNPIFFILTPDFSNYLCFLTTMVLAFVEHVRVFTAIPFTYAHQGFLKSTESLGSLICSLFNYNFHFPFTFMASFKSLTQSISWVIPETLLFPNSAVRLQWQPSHVTPIPLGPSNHRKAHGSARLCWQAAFDTRRS